MAAQASIRAKSFIIMIIRRRVLHNGKPNASFTPGARGELENLRRRLADADTLNAQLRAALAEVPPGPALERLAEGFILLDGEWRIRYTNRSAERLLGRKRSELTEADWWSIAGSDREFDYQRVVAGQAPVGFDQYYAPRETWFAVQVCPAAEGRIAVYLRDTDARQGGPRVTLDELAHALELSPVIVRSLTGVIRFWNTEAERMYGWTAAEAQGRVSHSLLETTFPEPLDEIERRLLATGSWRGQLNHRRKDGVRICVDSRWTLHCDAAGDPIAVIESNSDVTAHSDLAETRSASEQRLRSIMRTTPMIFFAVDRRGVCTLSEGQGLAAIGMAPGEAVGKNVFDFSLASSADLDHLRQALAGTPVRTVLIVADRVFDTWLTPERNAAGGVVGVFGVANDVTDRHRAEAERDRQLSVSLEISAALAHGGHLQAALKSATEALVTRLGLGVRPDMDRQQRR